MIKFMIFYKFVFGYFLAKSTDLEREREREESNHKYL